MSGINDWDEYQRQQDIERLQTKRELDEERFATETEEHQDDDSSSDGE